MCIFIFLCYYNAKGYMMKKSVNLYFSNNKLEKEKLIQIKSCGFDEFFTDIYDEGENLSLVEQINFAKSLGLECTMIHCLYNEKNLHFFWEKGVDGDILCEEYGRQIEMSKGLTKNFVIHLNASKDQKQSVYGLKRLRKLLEICDDCDINLCIENLYSDKEIPYVFRYIINDRLKICYDIGHQNFLTPDFDIVGKYGRYVNVLHMHDNHGIKDEHLICGKGSIEWKKVADSLRLIPNIVLSAEIRNDTDNYEKFLKDVFESLCKIEQLMK